LAHRCRGGSLWLVGFIDLGLVVKQYEYIAKEPFTSWQPGRRERERETLQGYGCSDLTSFY
jgi:hypothetical protein